MENTKYGRRGTPIRAKAQDTRANPNSWETRLVRKRWDIRLLRALSPRIMMMMILSDRILLMGKMFAIPLKVIVFLSKEGLKLNLTIGLNRKFKILTDAVEALHPLWVGPRSGGLGRPADERRSSRTPQFPRRPRPGDSVLGYSRFTRRY